MKSWELMPAGLMLVGIAGILVFSENSFFDGAGRAIGGMELMEQEQMHVRELSEQLQALAKRSIKGTTSWPR